MGVNSNGSGFLGFDHVRIPRDQLLMKNSQVLEVKNYIFTYCEFCDHFQNVFNFFQDGTYVKSINNKLSYATMVFVRVLVVQVSFGEKNSFRGLLVDNNYKYISFRK